MANIFDSECDAIVNTINCVGVMGGGLAKQFRSKYPDMNAAYQAACARGQVEIGRMWSWYDDASGRWIINFPTKDDWRDPSCTRYVIEGMADLVDVITDLGLRSIAIPPLGCGLGGLKWDEVEPLILVALDHVKGVQVNIYEPDGGLYTIQT